MKVVIDISQLHPLALKRGVGFYTLNLFKSLKELKDKNQFFLQKNKKEKIKADLIHYPYFDPFFLTLPLVKNKPTVVTIHDLTLLKFPQYYPSGVRGKIKWQIQKISLKGVKAIITDSKNSKKDIEKIIGFPKEKIFVVYLACGKEFKKLKVKSSKSKVKEKYRLPDDFILYVGDLNWNKNVKGLIQAFKKLKVKSLKLVLVGEAFVNPELLEAKEIKRMIKEWQLEDKILILGFIPTRDLVAIYNLATLYVQPSFYEGFGLPVLEAMSCGCPVLSSNQASLPEVGERAVEYFNPYKKKELVEKLFFLLSNKEKLKELSIKGLKQAKKFFWKKTALETKKIYEKVLS